MAKALNWGKKWGTSGNRSWGRAGTGVALLLPLTLATLLTPACGLFTEVPRTYSSASNATVIFRDDFAGAELAISAGAKVVNIMSQGWDSHGDIDGRVVRLQLTGLGYPVLEAASGDEAADILNAVPEIGLLLSDVVMPGSLNGRALAKFARTSRPQVRVVLMSGYTDEAHNAPTLDELPPVPLLKKPFTQAQLSALLDEVTLCHSQAT